jgi:hypothetical protein
MLYALSWEHQIVAYLVYGIAPARPQDGHSGLVQRMPSHWQLDLALRRIGAAVHEGQVLLGDPALGEVARKRVADAPVQGDHEQSGRVLVEPVDNAWPEAVQPRELGIVVQEQVDQGRPLDRWCRMDDQSSGLVQDDQVLVRMAHGQSSGYGLWNGLLAFSGKAEHLPQCDLLPGFGA